MKKRGGVRSTSATPKLLRIQGELAAARAAPERS
jgi:hypothetical protein